MLRITTNFSKSFSKLCTENSIPFSSVGNSCAGNKLIDWISSNVRCVSTSKVRIESISSSKNLSEMEPHFPLGKDLKVIRAQHIHHVLVLALRNDILLTLIVIAIFNDKRSPFLIKRTLCCRYFGGHTRCINVLIGKTKMPFLVFCKWNSALKREEIISWWGEKES